MNEERIVEISHGAGGRKMDELISFISKIIDIKNNQEDIIGPEEMDDSSILPIDVEQREIVMTTDSHTVDPIFFRGGNIGSLAVAGTINDLVVMGSKPQYLTLGLIIEEGFKFNDLAEICKSIGEMIKNSEVRIVTGDTKVMPKGKISNLVINTAGVGKLIRKTPIRDSAAQKGDMIIITGSIGDHGASLISLREGLNFETKLASDLHSFWPSFKDIITDPKIRCMKDITRGGFASAANEIASKSKVCLKVNEDQIPIKPEVQAICDILGFEVLEISCEGKALMIVENGSELEIIKKLKKFDFCKDASIIGYVDQSPQAQVHIITDIGGTRQLMKPYGEPIPRVC